MNNDFAYFRYSSVRYCRNSKAKNDAKTMEKVTNKIITLICFFFLVINFKASCSFNSVIWETVDFQFD